MLESEVRWVRQVRLALLLLAALVVVCLWVRLGLGTAGSRRVEGRAPESDTYWLGDSNTPARPARPVARPGAPRSHAVLAHVSGSYRVRP